MLCLLSVLLGLSWVSLRGSRERSDSRAGALQIADLLRDLRQQSITSGRPTALALPSTVSESFYELQGEKDPKVRRVQRLNNNYGNVKAFLGQYAGPTWSTSRPQGLLGSAPTLSTWNSAAPSASLVYFSPDGTCFSDAAHDQGKYRLIVGQQIEASNSTPPNLLRVYRPMTISISLLGAIEVESGLPGASTGLVLDAPFASSPSSPPPGAGSGNGNPFFVDPKLTVSPKAEAATLTNVTVAGSNYTVPLGELLTLETFANDPDGDALFCEWSCSGPAGSGSFSASNGHRMSWDSQKNCWVGRWSWTPPLTAQPDELYSLNCRVYDASNGVASSVPIAAMLPKVGTIAKGSLVYTAVDGDGRCLWSANWDGTNARKLVRPVDLSATAQSIRQPKFSPDGRSIAFVATDPADPSPEKLWLCDRNGSNLALLTSYLGPRMSGLAWDPLGSWIYTLHDDGSGTYSKKWKPGVTGQLGPPFFGIYPNVPSGPAAYINAHPQGKMLLYSQAGDLCVVWTDHSAQPGKFERFSGTGAAEPVFDASGGSERILYYKGLLGSEQLFWRSFTHNDATCTSTVGPEQVLYTGTPFQSPEMSSDGRWLITQDTSGGRLKLVLFKVPAFQPMTLNLPGTDPDHATFSP